MKIKKFYGIVEGFEAKPDELWSWKERKRIISLMIKQQNLNTYLYCPNSDRYISKRWDKNYPESQLKNFRRISNFCNKNDVIFGYGFRPRMNNIRKIDKGFTLYLQKIEKRIKQISNCGANLFCILFDTIPFSYNAYEGLDSPEAVKYARVQCRIVNFIKDKLLKPNQDLWFCSSEYFFIRSSNYIEEINSQLNSNISLIWTGKEIFTRKVSKKSLENALKITNNRELILWNNYPVNDAPIKRGLYNLGGFNPPQNGVLKKLSGILVNPMIQSIPSLPNIETFSRYLENPADYNRSKSYKSAIRKITCSTEPKVTNTIIEFSRRSAIDFNFKYGYKTIKKFKTRRECLQYREELVNILKITNESQNLLINSIPEIITDIKLFSQIITKLFNSKNLSKELKDYLNFPLEFDTISLQSILKVFCLQLYINSIFDTNLKIFLQMFNSINKDKPILPLKGNYSYSRNINMLIFYYNKYLKKNKTDITNIDRKVILKNLNTLQKREQNDFISKITISNNVSKVSKLKCVALKKNINRHNQGSIIEEASKLIYNGK